jgi:hypothetical protein
MWTSVITRLASSSPLFPITKMTQLLAILIPGFLAISVPFLIAKLLKIKLFNNTNSYDDGFIDGYILGEYDD